MRKIIALVTCLILCLSAACGWEEIIKPSVNVEVSDTTSALATTPPITTTTAPETTTTAAATTATTTQTTPETTSAVTTEQPDELSETTIATEEEPDEDYRFTVFWGETGYKMHLDRYCRTLTIAAYSGTYDEAYAAGRTEGWCGVCSRGMTDDKFFEDGNPKIR